MELLLIIAGVGASLMLCATRGWMSNSRIMADACDILIGIGVNNIYFPAAISPAVRKFVFGPQKYIALALLVGVTSGVFILFAEGHKIGACIVSAVILLCNTWPTIFHQFQNGWYFKFHDLGNEEDEYKVGLNVIGVHCQDDTAINDIPQDLIVAVGKGGLLYISGVFVGFAGGIVSAATLAFTYFFVLE